MVATKFAPQEKVWAWVSGNQTFEVATLERHEAHKSLCYVKLKTGVSIELKDELVHKMNLAKQDAVPDNTFMWRGRCLDGPLSQAAAVLAIQRRVWPSPHGGNILNAV